MLIVRALGLMIVSVIPLAAVRHFLYRSFFGYRIMGKSKIGMFNYISCREVFLQDALIGTFNFIVVSKLTMATNSSIVKRNRIKHLNTVTIQEKGLINIGNFIGAQKTSEPPFSIDAQNLYLGKKSEILRNNYFDVVRPIVIGNNVVFGGQGSEIWTHGFEVDRTMLVGGVTFGDDIFIGSRCIFTKNVQVASNVTIGPGSVVYKSINESGFYSSHQLQMIR